MRWKLLNPKVYLYLSNRVIRKFAWLPVCVAREYRWLETVYVAQIWTAQDKVYYLTEYGDYYWYNWSFVTEKDYITFKESVPKGRNYINYHNEH